MKSKTRTPKAPVRTSKKIRFIDYAKPLFAVLIYNTCCEKTPPMIEDVLPRDAARQLAADLNGDSEVSGLIARLKPIKWQLA